MLYCVRPTKLVCKPEHCNSKVELISIEFDKYPQVCQSNFMHVSAFWHKLCSDVRKYSGLGLRSKLLIPISETVPISTLILILQISTGLPYFLFCPQYEEEVNRLIALADRTYYKLLLSADIGSDSCRWLHGLHQPCTTLPFCMEYTSSQSSSFKGHFCWKYLNPLTLPLNLKWTNWHRWVAVVMQRYQPSTLLLQRMILFSWRHVRCARRGGAVCVRHVSDGGRVWKGNAAEWICCILSIEKKNVNNKT